MAAVDVNRVVLHHDLGRVGAVTVWLALAAAVPAALRGGAGWSLPAVLAVGSVLGWLLGWRPGLVVDDDGVTLRNPLRVVRLPWSQVQDVAMGWTLTVTAAGVAHRVWAVPGPRRMQALWDRGWSEEEGVLVRSSIARLERASARGEGAIGLGGAGLVVAQRWAARGTAPTSFPG